MALNKSITDYLALADLCTENSLTTTQRNYINNRRATIYLLDDPINWNSFFNYPPIAHLANHANRMTDFVQEFGIPWQKNS